MKLLSAIGNKQVTLELQRDSSSSVCFRVDEESGEADIRVLAPRAYSVMEGRRHYDVRIHECGNGIFDVAVNGVAHQVTVTDPRRWAPGGDASDTSGPRKVIASMPGKVVKLLVHEGEQVEAAQGLAIVEAMKMQNAMKSPKAGRVAVIEVVEGGSVAAGETLVVIE
jgi:biotin carboxyl carrier protein